MFEVTVDGRAAQPWSEAETKEVRDRLGALVIRSDERYVLRAFFGISPEGVGSLSYAAEQRFREASNGIKDLISATFVDGRPLAKPTD